ncbi:hypothetical protein K0H71_15115 [Bacillus sp. IITD106]|nr:hypothetical protein [Bacillus sp. IITD106]
MEFKDDVFYVTPDGQAIQRNTIRILVVKARDLWESIMKIIQDAATILSEKVKELFGLLDTEKKLQRQAWNTPKNIIRKSQVMNRKPLFIHARSRL